LLDKLVTEDRSAFTVRNTWLRATKTVYAWAVRRRKLTTNPDVLEGLNWQIHRVWSTDWYRDPEREFASLVQNIERLRTLH